MNKKGDVNWVIVGAILALVTLVVVLIIQSNLFAKTAGEYEKQANVDPCSVEYWNKKGEDATKRDINNDGRIDDTTGLKNPYTKEALEC